MNQLSPSALCSMLLAAFTLVGCGSDGVATLSGALEKPSVTVTRSVLVGDVSGGFELFLELGEFAAGPTEVSLGAFVLERDDTVLLSALPLSGGMFPVSVGVDQKTRIPLTFTRSADLALADELCAGPVAFRGTVSDTLGKNRPTTLHSADVTPTCTGP